MTGGIGSPVRKKPRPAVRDRAVQSDVENMNLPPLSLGDPMRHEPQVWRWVSFT